jgi:hypothetical protein
MNTPDFRALCAELLDWIERDSQGHVYGTQDLITRARAALAQSEGEGPTIKQVSEWICSEFPEPSAFGYQHHDVLRIILAALARWGHPAPPAPGDPNSLVITRARAALAEPEGEGPSERIISIAKAIQEHAFGWEPDARLIGNVCAEDVADLCSAVLARWGRPTSPAPEPGEVREVAEALRGPLMELEPWAGLPGGGWESDKARKRILQIIKKQAKPL